MKLKETDAVARKEVLAVLRTLSPLCNHHWDGCICSVCGEKRDEGHHWNGCKCLICGRVRSEGHSWNGCKCKSCGQTRDQEHDYRYIPEDSSGTQEWEDHGEYMEVGKGSWDYKCSICGKTLMKDEYWTYLRQTKKK